LGWSAATVQGSRLP